MHSGGNDAEDSVQNESAAPREEEPQNGGEGQKEGKLMEALQLGDVDKQAVEDKRGKVELNLESPRAIEACQRQVCGPMRGFFLPFLAVILTFLGCARCLSPPSCDCKRVLKLATWSSDPWRASLRPGRLKKSSRCGSRATRNSVW